MESFSRMKDILKIKTVTNFIKTRFYWKQDCIKMCKYAEPFNTNKGFYIDFLIFNIEIWGIFLKPYLGKNDALLTLAFISKWTILILSFIWHETNGYTLRPWGLVFWAGLLFIMFRILVLVDVVLETWINTM